MLSGYYISECKYMHYKNKKHYNIKSLVSNSAGENFILYQGDYLDEELGYLPLFVQPIDRFFGEVEHEGEMVKRFTRIP